MKERLYKSLECIYNTIILWVNAWRPDGGLLLPVDEAFAWPRASPVGLDMFSCNKRQGWPRSVARACPLHPMIGFIAGLYLFIDLLQPHYSGPGEEIQAARTMASLHVPL